MYKSQYTIRDIRGLYLADGNVDSGYIYLRYEKPSRVVNCKCAANHGIQLLRLN